MSFLNIVVCLHCMYSILFHSFDRQKDGEEEGVKKPRLKKMEHQNIEPTIACKTDLVRGFVWGKACTKKKTIKLSVCQMSMNSYQTFFSHLKNNFNWNRFVLFTITRNMEYLFTSHSVMMFGVWLCLCIQYFSIFTIIYSIFSSASILRNPSDQQMERIAVTCLHTKHHMTMCVCKRKSIVLWHFSLFCFSNPTQYNNSFQNNFYESLSPFNEFTISFYARYAMHWWVSSAHVYMSISMFWGMASIKFKLFHRI